VAAAASGVVPAIIFVNKSAAICAWCVAIAAITCGGGSCGGCVGWVVVGVEEEEHVDEEGVEGVGGLRGGRWDSVGPLSSEGSGWRRGEPGSSAEGAGWWGEPGLGGCACVPLIHTLPSGSVIRSGGSSVVCNWWARSNSL
jgi:hypothetical protein